MVFKLLILAATLFGFASLIWTQEKYSFIVTLTLALSILIIFIPSEFLKETGSFLLPLGVLFSVAYGAFYPNLESFKRISILCVAIPVGLSQLGFFLNLEDTSVFGYLMFIPAISYLYAIVIKGFKEFKNQIGFLTILFSYALSRIAVLVQHNL